MRQVGVNSLRSGDVLGKSIYSGSGRVLLSKGVKLTDPFINRLKEMGITMLYIDDEQFYDVVAEDIIPDEQRREAMELVERSSQTIRQGKDIDSRKVQSMITSMVTGILGKKNVLYNVMDMRSRDNATYAHSVNICVLSIVLGKAMQLSMDKLETLAMGALLHDVGMVQLEQALVNKTQGLTPEDFEKLKAHTTLGFETLRRQRDVSLIVAHIAFQHHENYDGTGYPRRLKADEIHPLAQIVAIADLYDKLTSDHSGIKRVMPHEACEILMGLAGKVFPQDLVVLFLRNIAAYPNGISVRLNTGEVGVVVNQNPSLPARPVVRVYAEHGLLVGKGKEYNLFEHPTVFISDVLN